MHCSISGVSTDLRSSWGRVMRCPWVPRSRCQLFISHRDGPASSLLFGARGGVGGRVSVELIAPTPRPVPRRWRR